MREFLEQFAPLSDFMAHGYCLVWDPVLLFLHVGSDLATGFAYLLIAAALFYLVSKRGDLPYYWLFHLFGAFITACAVTHFFAVWTIYVPSYLAEGLIKAGTAVVSIATVLLLIPRLPEILALPNLSRALEEIKGLNHELQSQFEAALRSENRHRSLIEASYDAIVIADSEGKIVSLNPAAVRMFGYHDGELEGQPLTILMPEYYRERHAAGLGRFVASGRSSYLGKSLDFIGLRKDGREFPLELNISSWRAEGQVNFGGIIRDMSERVRMEEEIVHSWQLFKTLMDSIEALVYVADFKTYELLFINKYGQKIWGDITGRVCWQALQSGQDGPCPFCTNHRLFDAGGRPTGVYVWEFQNTVNLEWYECRDQAIKWIDGRYVRMEIATNITARKRAEQEKEEFETRLRVSQKMEAIGTLAGGIAHDFNNILVPIMAYTEIAMGNMEEDSENRQHLQEILKATNRARELVKQILTFSREREHEAMPVQIMPVVKESLKLIRASLPSTIEINQQLDADGVTVLADPTQIHQIVMNLCTNAYHAMRERGGVMEVTLSEVQIAASDAEGFGLAAGTYLALSVSDTGTGMDRAIRERVFEPYFTTRGQGEGTGLGLAVVHGIVKKYGGEIRVYSEPGQGSSFQVYLPVFGRSDEGIAAVISAPLAMAKAGERILLVDDDQTIGEAMLRMLEFHGYQVVSHTSSPEALAAFRLAPEAYDLVITDQTMPEITGAQLIGELRRIRPGIPVILCTGFSTMIDEVKARELGFNAFFMKPAPRLEITEAVRRILDEALRSSRPDSSKKS